jgi:hypothetical protein
MQHLPERLLVQEVLHLNTVRPLGPHPGHGLLRTDRHPLVTYLQEALLLSSLVSLVSNSRVSTASKGSRLLMDKPLLSKVNTGRQHPNIMDKLLNTEVLRLSSRAVELERPILATS